MLRFTTAFLFLFLFLNTNTFAASQCDTSIDTRIRKLMESDAGFLAALSEQLSAKGKKSVISDTASQSLRKLHCELEKICEGVDRAFYQRENANLDFTCSYSVQEKGKAVSPVTAFTKEDFVGKNAICIFQENESALALQSAQLSCKQKTAFIEAQIFPFVYQQYSLASRQDEANYYSAKLLSITSRLQNLGDKFQILNQEIRRSFESIGCRCNR